MLKILQVAVPTPLWQCFDYKLPLNLNHPVLTPGMRLKVPFGRQERVGVLMGVTESSSLGIDQLKSVFSILDSEPLIPPSLIKLCRWASDYYHHPIGEVIFGVLPPWLRQEKVLSLDTSISKKRVTQEKTSTIITNPAQNAAINAINACDDFSVFLLAGITGSGKTEVYLRCISKILSCGKQALILVPEIALTPQTIKRFEDRFDVPIVALHSNLSDKKRAEAWLMAKNNMAKIIIGTRSAVFTPLANPGIIIMDEEHDTSFKQQSGFRYSARDLSVIRGHMENIPIVLGSATPSLESLCNVNRGRYTLLSLPDRAGKAIPPTIKLIDIRRQPLLSGISEPLLAAIEEHVNHRQQVLLFLNRRGYAPTLMCHACGHVMSCERCDARLTLHHHPTRLYCHHCGSSSRSPSTCPSCRQANMIDIGLGTERLEETLQQRFPHFNLLRIDRDSTRRKKSIEEKLKKMHDHEADILIGTQMIAKGHHFPNLTLVAIIDLDSGFYSSDFRAIERMGQLLVQVSGRAGREEKVGEVLIQTHHPDNPLLTKLLTKGYDAFAEALLKEREAVQLPPYIHAALLRAEAVKKELPPQFLLKAKQFASSHSGEEIQVFGPIPATMERKAGRYRHQLLVQSKNRASLHRLLDQLIHHLSHEKMRQVRWSLDVDPQEML